MVIVVQGKRFKRAWLESVSLKVALSICTDTKADVVTEAWNIAHGITEKPKTSRNRTK